MEVFKFLNNNLFALITAIVAIIALFQTKKQIKMSNKQYLFDRRIKNYTVIMGLINLFKDNEYLLKEKHKESEPIVVDFLFYGLTNNTYLENLQNIMEHPLEQPYQKNFLIKLEELSSIANEIKFLYKGYDDITEFVNDYVKVLHSIYKYQILNKNMKDSAENFKLTYEQAQKNANEPYCRKKLLESYNDLILVYNKINKNDTLKKMEKEIKL